MDDPKKTDSQSRSDELRELARRIQNETDARKMTELIEQLIAKLDEQSAPKGAARVSKSA